ncbi:putative C2H2 finger domain protein [Aspergillus niger CBS 101883]|uniref:putative C2H2 finger domain protein n=1 Tax=Aspergillus lacticoffeatus (strain CBS 101883) TaxID=1450533 RepID=UPI000D8035DB|nr:uncharacterized protein BO96DRAFT_450258 [Aspergillus niger CBS 101883]PYH51869.1 hypothetical protein BO96DRAFT_450258 [Aspergillus niger CBS 101883]
MSSEDLQWLESYLRHGYDPEAQGVDEHAAFYQSNPYFAMPPSSSYTAAHNGSAGSHGYQYSNERDVRPGSFPENQHHTSTSRSHQMQYPQASTVAPPPGSHTESSSRFAAPFGPKSLPSKSPRPPPSQDYTRAHQLPKPVQTRRTGPPAGVSAGLISSATFNPSGTVQTDPASDIGLFALESASCPAVFYRNLKPTSFPVLECCHFAPGTADIEYGTAAYTSPSSQFTSFTYATDAIHYTSFKSANDSTSNEFTHYSDNFSSDIQLGSSSDRPNRPAVKFSASAYSACAYNAYNPAIYDAARKYHWNRYATAPAENPPAGGLSIYNYSPQIAGSGFPASKSYLKSRADIVTPLREEDAVDKVIYDPKTIARDVLIAAGRHPTEEALNHHLLRLRDVFVHVDSSSDLSTFRWDLVDALEPRDQGPPKPQPRPRPAPSLPVLPNNTNTSLPPPPQSRQPPPLPQSQPVRQYPSSQPLQGQPVSGPPVGLSKAAPQPQNRPSVSAATPLPQTRPQPPSTPQPPSQSSVPITTTQVTPMTGKRGPGRPPGSSKARQQPQQTPIPASVPYPVFACDWTNCQAQLHNLDGLKKHVFKVHVSQTLNCAWRGCSFPDALPAAALFKHVKKEHLEPIAWKLGDGPAVPLTVGNDASGSPGPLGILDTAQPNTEDSLIFPASYSSIRAFNRVHGNNTQQEKAREILKAVQRLKEQIGVGLDPGGCELATPARNERLSNDEDVYEVVPAT